ncbi:MAG: isocitrate/isopropylmalate dehydrogenase family protein [Nitrososphaerota archaeon]
MVYDIAIIPGDGIGPEQIEATLIVLDAIQEKLNLKFKYSFLEAGDNCFKKYGIALPEETIKAIEKADATLKGPVGETAAEVIVKLRQLLDLYANLRPAKSYPNIPSLKPNIDLLIVRENTECLYKGFEYRISEEVAIGIRVITKKASLRIAQCAFKEASKRKLKVTVVHKSNVLKATCGLFAEACREVSKQYPNIKYEEMYVDAAAMELIRSPEKFDVIVTTNMFGDILSDEAAQIVGGLGLAPSANIGYDKALFEPVHGAAFDIAGKNIANPSSTILSSKMMLEWLHEKYGDKKCLEAAKIIEEALILAFEKGYTTKDLGGKLSTKEMGLKIASLIKEF